METALYIAGVLGILILLWLNVLATVAVRHDTTLEDAQKVGQSIIVWLVPFLGATFILHLVWQLHPEAIPKSWIPWPFKKLIFGKPIKPNTNRDEREPDILPRRGSHDNYFDSSGSDGDGD